MLSDEERKLRIHLMHNKAQRSFHKKMIRTENNKKRGKIGNKKMRARLEKWLKPLAIDLLRQKVEKEGQPALKQAKEWLATCKKQCERLMKCANNLFDLVGFTKKQQITCVSLFQTCQQENKRKNT